MQTGTVYVDWNCRHRLELYTQTGTVQADWNTTIRLELYTQTGTIKADWNRYTQMGNAMHRQEPEHTDRNTDRNQYTQTI